MALSTGYDIKAGNFTFGPVSSLLYSLGAQAAYRWEVTKKFAVTPMVSASWQHEFLQNATEETDAVIRKFRKEVPMDYSVATDTSGRLSEKMGINGIPHAFLVNKSGEIVWDGHPMQLTDEDIEKILE